MQFLLNVVGVAITILAVLLVAGFCLIVSGFGIIWIHWLLRQLQMLLTPAYIWIQLRRREWQQRRLQRRPHAHYVHWSVRFWAWAEVHANSLKLSAELRHTTRIDLARLELQRQLERARSREVVGLDDKISSRHQPYDSHRAMANVGKLVRLAEEPAEASNDERFRRASRASKGWTDV